jgi:hypothetical protein
VPVSDREFPYPKFLEETGFDSAETSSLSVFGLH